MTEQWREWRDGTYEVSGLGNIRRAKPGISTFVGRPVKPLISAGGYAQVHLASGGKTHRVYVHHVVMEAFKGTRQSGLVVNHIDGTRTNNALANLEYVTQKENVAHALAAGIRRRGPSMPPRQLKGRPSGCAHWTQTQPERIARAERMPHSKMTQETVAAARLRATAGEKQSALAAEYEISPAQMSRIIRGTRWTA